ncbi:hypothetical protein [Polaromonas sp. YR568]|uniref:hypothetical protein n=1 Tax=Polaromonas sp. YR568 TaxID=1855301 RepID=UPI0031379343
MFFQKRPAGRIFVAAPEATPLLMRLDHAAAGSIGLRHNAAMRLVFSTATSPGASRPMMPGKVL